MRAIILTVAIFYHCAKDNDSQDCIDELQISNRLDGINDNDTASIIYTSGTTGNPKGVELTYNNFNFELDCLLSFLAYDQGEKFISWLPGAHVFGQALDNHYWIRTAMHMYIADNPLNTVDIAKVVQPSLFISVPRVYDCLLYTSPSPRDRG